MAVVAIVGVGCSDAHSGAGGAGRRFSASGLRHSSACDWGTSSYDLVNDARDICVVPVPEPCGSIEGRLGAAGNYGGSDCPGRIGLCRATQSLGRGISNGDARDFYGRACCVRGFDDGLECGAGVGNFLSRSAAGRFSVRLNGCFPMNDYLQLTKPRITWLILMSTGVGFFFG